MSLNNLMNYFEHQLSEMLDYEFGDDPLPDRDQFGQLNPVRDKIADENGNLPTYTWPGGYQIIYITADGGVLCPDCANLPEVKDADEHDKQWWLVADSSFHDGPVIQCDHCGKDIESDYGDPNAPEEGIVGAGCI